MKKSLLFLVSFLLLGSFFAKSQDLIVTKTDSIKGKIIDVDSVEINYSFLSNGVVLSNTLPLSEIVSYKYNYFDNVVSNRPTVKSLNYPRFKFSLDGGYSRRVGRTSPDASPVERDYINGLKSGFNIGSDINYYLGETYGLGLKYIYFRTSNQIDNATITFDGVQYTGKLRDDITMQTIGPFFTSRIYDKRKINFFNVSAGLGYSFYTNQGYLIDNLLMKGGAYTTFAEIGYDRMISSKLAIGIRFTLLSAALRSYDVTFQRVTNHVELTQDQIENLSRFDISIGFRFIK